MFDYLEVEKIKFRTSRLELVSPTEMNVESLYNRVGNIQYLLREFSETYEPKESFINMFRVFSLMTSTEEHFIIKEIESGKYIGHIWIFDENKIGYALCDDVYGKGYSAEAVSELIEYLMSVLKYNSVNARVYSWNEVFIGLVQKCDTRVLSTIDELHCKVITFILFNTQYKQPNLCLEL